MHKVWDDANDAHGVRPTSISVQLHADGETVATVELTADMGWEYTFTNLPELNEDGESIAYSVTETKVEYYETLIAGTTITNRLEEKTPKAFTEIAGAKTWVDNDDAAGRRPGSITVQLLRDGEVYRELVVTSATGWRYTFSELPVDDGYGHDYVYEIHELGVPGYFGMVEGYDLTNTLLGGVTVETRRTGGGGGSEKTPTTHHGRVAQTRRTGTPPPMKMNDLNDEELEELFDMFGYGVPLWGQLMPTGDETPAWPWIFAGIGAAALMAIPVIGRKRRRRRT